MPDALQYQWLNNGLLLGAMLFAIAVVGFVVRRDLTGVLLSAGIMGQGGLVALIGSSAFRGDASGQMLAAGLVIVTTLSLFLGGMLASTLLRRGAELNLSARDQLHDPELPDSGQVDEPTVPESSSVADQGTP